MVAASIVAVPKQLNSREEDKSIKNGLNHFGDQNQIEIDVKHKLIGRDDVRPAWVPDRYVWPDCGLKITAARMCGLTRLIGQRQKRCSAGRWLPRPHSAVIRS